MLIFIKLLSCMKIILYNKERATCDGDWHDGHALLIDTDQNMIPAL